MLRQFGVVCGPSVRGGLEVSLSLDALTLDNASTIKLLDIPVSALTFCTVIFGVLLQLLGVCPGDGVARCGVGYDCLSRRCC